MVVMTDTSRDQQLEELAGRVDHLELKMDQGFRKLDEGIHESREEMRQLRTEINTRFNLADTKLNGYDMRFDTVQYMIIRVGAAALVTMLIGFLGIIVTAH